MKNAVLLVVNVQESLIMDSPCHGRSATLISVEETIRGMKESK